ncbi:MAG: DnaJ domain-containing protein [Deltaproteobacteria bacterium]|nr:DnaJ domain-containing protein [Deltaproteobacteria bacterium]
MLNVAPNYYQLLQVDPSAAPEVIQSAYRTLMTKLRMHPDLGGHTETACRLNEAYAVLRDPAQRHVYDQQLIEASTRTSTISHLTDTHNTRNDSTAPPSARRHIRRPGYHRAIIAQTPHRAPLTGQLLDLSAQGAKLRLAAADVPTGPIAVQCSEFAACGRVAWSRCGTGAAANELEVGLQFDNLTLHGTYFLLSTHA